MAQNVPILELNRVTAGPLDRVDATVGAGAITAVVGPVGSGRTTLAHLVAGVARPLSGRIVLDGVDVTDVDAASRARFGLGWVRSRPRPFPSLSVSENVLAAASAARRLGGREAFARTRDLLDRYGLAEVADRPAWQLDPGAAARLEVVRVLAAPRRLLVVDELTTSLPAADVPLMSAALAATARQGGAVLWLDVPGRLPVSPDHVVLLAAGRVVAAGPPAVVGISAEWRATQPPGDGAMSAQEEHRR